MIEAPGLFSKLMRFDGTILEIVSHGASTARIVVSDITEMKRMEDGDALTVLIAYATDRQVIGFSAEQRAEGEKLVAAVEAARKK